MSVLVSGRVRAVTTRMAGHAPDQWEETTIVVEDWGQTLYLTVGKNFRGAVPSEGEFVALDASVRAYVNKAGNAGIGWTAFGRSEYESAIAPQRAATV